MIDSTSVGYDDVPNPPTTAAKLITIEYETKVDGLSSSTTPSIVSPLSGTKSYELMLGECSWTLNLKSSITFPAAISIISEMNPAIWMPKPTVLLEMYN